MDKPTPPADPLPPRVAWFAPWTWNPWKQWALFLLLMSSYPLSTGPVAWLDGQRYLSESAVDVMRVIYTPLLIAQEHSQIVRDAMMWYVGLWYKHPSPFLAMREFAQKS